MSSAIRKLRGSTTLMAHKTNGGALGSARPAVEARGLAPAPAAAGHLPHPAVQAAAAAGATPAVAPILSKPVYRASARLEPPAKEFPSRLVLTLFATVLVVAGAFVAWRYFQSKTPAERIAPAVKGAESRKVESPQHLTPKTGDASKSRLTIPAPPPPRRGKARTNLSFPEKAKINELNGLGDVYLKQSGCDKAVPEYQQVLQIDPGDARAYKGIISCYSKVKAASHSARRYALRGSGNSHPFRHRALSPQGINSIAGGNAPGRRQPKPADPERVNKINRPLQGRGVTSRLPGALPPAIIFCPFRARQECRFSAAS